MKAILAALPLLLVSATALAQGQPAQSVVPGNAGSRGPGGLSAAEAEHKWLLDANGATVGWIEGAANDGAAVTVKTQDGRRITVPLRRLSLGNGPNTVIEGGHSEADDLNRLQLSSPAKPK
ncbi:MAG TPA: hypothetical protein VKS60_08360 [Stellaceae bacterium]|nr:hypothetical protein [Stellaceae bacterium]